MSISRRSIIVKYSIKKNTQKSKINFISQFYINIYMNIRNTLLPVYKFGRNLLWHNNYPKTNHKIYSLQLTMYRIIWRMFYHIPIILVIFMKFCGVTPKMTNMNFFQFKKKQNLPIFQVLSSNGAKHRKQKSRWRKHRIWERGGAVVGPLACLAKVPGFKSRQNLSCPPSCKRVRDIRHGAILSDC